MLSQAPPELADESLEYWFRASKLTGYTGGDSVNPLADSSGEGSDYEQPVAAGQMIYRGGYVEADGDDFYEQRPSGYEQDPEAVTWFMVARIPPSVTTSGRLIAHREDSTRWIELWVNGLGDLRMDARDSDGVRIVAETRYTNNLAVIVGRFDSAIGHTHVWFDDGVTPTENTNTGTYTGDFSASIRNIGANRNGIDIIAGLELYEVAQYRTPLTNAQVADRIDYLKSFRGI